jgi:hypothetical protein
LYLSNVKQEYKWRGRCSLCFCPYLQCFFPHSENILSITAKLKVSLCLSKHHAMKTYGEWKYSSTILDIGTRWRWVVSFMPQRLYHLGNSPRYQLDRRLCGHQSWSGRSE